MDVQLGSTESALEPAHAYGAEEKQRRCSKIAWGEHSVTSREELDQMRLDQRRSSLDKFAQPQCSTTTAPDKHETLSSRTAQPDIVPASCCTCFGKKKPTAYPAKVPADLPKSALRRRMSEGSATCIDVSVEGLRSSVTKSLQNAQDYYVQQT
eukprot:CAMPEP_0119314754 /NCGR_PEP_ID=MMETSP1333-20130426/33939_1 /TAXON_ID=418940 /ORGANISM="Scyphosphaera apsteinii, Strain RCC1455" /LENGTH=152 /DNA_ID=CAMNT_0007319949 /DNA_START=133 /DNA_END=587 /DNA_ORIENTATION=+